MVSTLLSWLLNLFKCCWMSIRLCVAPYQPCSIYWNHWWVWVGVCVGVCGCRCVGVDVSRTLSCTCITTQEETDYVKTLGVTIELVNKNLFRELIFAESFMSSNLPLIIAQLRLSGLSADPFHRSTADTLSQRYSPLTSVSSLNPPLTGLYTYL